jgi:hypothetical protein
VMMVVDVDVVGKTRKRNAQVVPAVKSSSRRVKQRVCAFRFDPTDTGLS